MKKMYAPGNCIARIPLLPFIGAGREWEYVGRQYPYPCMVHALRSHSYKGRSVGNNRRVRRGWKGRGGGGNEPPPKELKGARSTDEVEAFQNQQGERIPHQGFQLSARPGTSAAAALRRSSYGISNSISTSGARPSNVGKSMRFFFLFRRTA